MAEPRLNQEKERRIKMGVWVLIILGIVVTFLTLWQYPKYLRAPFAQYGQQKGLWKSTEQEELAKLMGMKEKDTDGDGLNDFDESYLYGTSAYLADSDSDGFNDKQEIESGNDPNCPVGKTCPKIEEGSPGAAPLPQELLGSPPPALGGILGGQASAEEVRNALRQAGMNEESLSKLDDQTLLELYQETLKETSRATLGANANTSLPANVNAASLTPDQLRELLRQAGVDEATLKSVDDATLMKIFQEMVNKGN